MSNAVKKTISLPPELARQAERMASEQGKTLSGVIQDALRLATAEQRKHEFADIQGYWSRKAKELGILTQDDLDRYLAE